LQASRDRLQRLLDGGAPAICAYVAWFDHLVVPALIQKGWDVNSPSSWDKSRFSAQPWRFDSNREDG
jgi:hypothetical protein